MKRFWNSVGIEKRDGALAITLDNRPLKTPSGNTLLLPGNKTLLASLVAAEWDHQETLLKPHALPVVRLLSCRPSYTLIRHRLRLRRGLSMHLLKTRRA